MLLALAGKELRLLLRDLHGLAVLFLMPTVFILIMSLALQNAFDRDAGPALKVAVTSDDNGDLGAAVIDQLRAGDTLRIVRDPETADFRLQLPADFSERVFEAPDDLDHPLLRWRSDATVLPQARAAFRAALIGAILRVQGEQLIHTVEQEQDTDLSRLREVMDPRTWHLEAGSFGDRQLPGAVQQSVPAWLVFAMFFVVVPLSTVMIIEREQGTELRLRALQVPGWRLLLGRLPPYFAVNMLQMVAMLAVGVYLVPVFGGRALDLGAHPLGLLPIGAATSVAALGLALLVAVLSRTSVQAIALGGTLNLIFGALGGVMVPKMVMPAGMQAATMLSPMSWALEGFWDILLRSDSVAATLPECAVLTAFGGFALALAAFLHNRQVTDPSTHGTGR